MVSDPSVSGSPRLAEGWQTLFDLLPHSVACSNLSAATAAAGAREPLPMFVHASQWASACANGLDWPACNASPRAAQWHFHKGHVPNAHMSCGSPLLLPPPENLFDTQATARGRRHAYIVCTMTSTFNDAARASCARTATASSPSSGCRRPTTSPSSASKFPSRTISSNFENHEKQHGVL